MAWWLQGEQHCIHTSTGRLFYYGGTVWGSAGAAQEPLADEHGQQFDSIVILSSSSHLARQLDKVLEILPVSVPPTHHALPFILQRSIIVATHTLPTMIGSFTMEGTASPP